MLLCFTLCVFSQFYFVTILEACIKYTKMRKTQPEQWRKGLGLGPVCAAALSWGTLCSSAAHWAYSSLTQITTEYRDI